MPNKPKICVINTGGTILSRFNQQAGGWVSSAGVADLAAQLPQVAALAELQVFEHSQINAYRMDLDTVLGIGRLVNEVVKDPSCDGVVVVHGTASMEETAYLLELTVDTQKPVVLTGAQRRFEDIGADGPVNFLHAVRLAATPAARGRGVMVVFDGSVHGARDVLKIHNQSLNGFGSRDGGAIAFVTATRVTFLACPDRRAHFPVPPSAPNVQLIKVAQGSDDILVRACIASKVDGIVIEGVGGGGVPDAVFQGICDALAVGIAVVVVARLPRGGVIPDGGGGGTGGGDYALNGSSGNLIASGAIPGGYLSGLKARILLMIALASTRDRAELARIFDRA